MSVSNMQERSKIEVKVKLKMGRKGTEGNSTLDACTSPNPNPNFGSWT
jgi:hypothetical protein